MANAKRDDNNVPVAIGLSSSDGSTPLMPYVDPTSHRLDIDDGTTGSDLTGDNALRDENQVTILMGVSEADGVTPVPIYINPTGNKLRIDSN